MSVIKSPNGIAADVDLLNRLLTFAVSQHEDKTANLDGRYWSIFFQITPTAANDLFFYLKNTGTKDLFITDVRISSSVATQLIYRQVAGVAVGGTDSEVTSRKLGDPAVPNAIIQHGVDITGLTPGGVLFFQETNPVDMLQSLKTTSNIIIPQGQALAFERVEATGLITGLVSLSEAT